MPHKSVIGEQKWSQHSQNLHPTTFVCTAGPSSLSLCPQSLAAHLPPSSVLTAGPWLGAAAGSALGHPLHRAAWEPRGCRTPLQVRACACGSRYPWPPRACTHTHTHKPVVRSCVQTCRVCVCADKEMPDAEAEGTQGDDQEQPLSTPEGVSSRIGMHGAPGAGMAVTGRQRHVKTHEGGQPKADVLLC